MNTASGLNSLVASSPSTAEKRKKFVWKQSSYNRQAGGCETTPTFGSGPLREGREEESSPEKEYFKQDKRSAPLSCQLPSESGQQEVQRTDHVLPIQPTLEPTNSTTPGTDSDDTTNTT